MSSWYVGDVTHLMSIQLSNPPAVLLIVRGKESERGAFTGDDLFVLSELVGAHVEGAITALVIRQ